MNGKPKGAPRGKPFAKGQTGNPHGRPKEYPELKALAREHTVEAVNTLAQIMRTGDSDAAKAMASDKLLDRGWGKAPQAMTGEDGEGPIKHEHVIEFRIVDPKPRSGD